MTDLKRFGNFIKEKRIEKGLTQKDLAALLYVSESAVSKWEIGQSYPDITRIQKLCSVLELSEHELINAATDLEYRKMNEDAGKWNKFVNTYFWAFTITYGVALVICLICNLAVNHTLSWFFTVFFSILTAFSFIPTATRFVETRKFEMFLVSTFGSMTLLFANCVIQYGGSWFLTAVSGVLFGYWVFFAPAILRKYINGKLKKWRLLAYFIVALLLLLMLLHVCTNDFKDSALTALYCYFPLLIIGINHIIDYRKQFKAAVDVAIFIPYLYGLSTILNTLYGEGTYSLKVDFTDWVNYSNGNVYLISSLLLFCVTVFLFVLGVVKKKEGNN